MTEEEYIDILKKQEKSITKEIQKEIDEQVKLSEDANKNDLTLPHKQSKAPSVLFIQQR